MPFSARAMRDSDWRSVRHFTPGEFKAPERMGWNFLLWLDQVRDACGVPMRVTSSYRTPQHNAQVGGAKDSAHCDTPCNAVDLMPQNNYERWQIVTAAWALGCRRIGVYADGSLHLDMTHDVRPAPRMWVVGG